MVQSFLLKPDMIKQHDPDFIEQFVPGRDPNQSKDLAQIKKLRKKIKREKRGALKKIRQDTAFMSQEKARIQAFKDKKRKQKVKEIMQMLQKEQNHMKVEQRIKARKKKYLKAGVISKF